MVNGTCKTCPDGYPLEVDFCWSWWIIHEFSDNPDYIKWWHYPIDDFRCAQAIVHPDTLFDAELPGGLGKEVLLGSGKYMDPVNFFRADDCTECVADVYKNDTRCLVTCPENTTPTPDMTCVACPVGCKTCSQYDPTQCTSCSGGWAYGSSCVPSCPTGSYEVRRTQTDQPRQCQQCAKGCAECTWSDATNTSVCQTCTLDHSMLNGHCRPFTLAALPQPPSRASKPVSATLDTAYAVFGGTRMSHFSWSSTTVTSHDITVEEATATTLTVYVTETPAVVTESQPLSACPAYTCAVVATTTVLTTATRTCSPTMTSAALHQNTTLSTRAETPSPEARTSQWRARHPESQR